MKGFFVKIRIITAVFFVLSFFISSAAELNITHGVVQCLNKRPYQEDTFVGANVVGGKFFAVYDGHNGNKTSSFLKENLHAYFQECLVENRKQCFEDSFAKAEKYALENYADGSTAVVAYIDSNKVLHYAWSGDSRAVLECNGKACFATDDHKPNRSDETRRIEQAGGTLCFYGVWRINGLAVSRSIGDKKMKTCGEGQIIAVPEYAQKQLNADNHFLIIASDGLWDVVSSEDAVAIAQKGFDDQKSVDDIAQELQNAAIKEGSKDNITVCVVKFD